jgi:hypothetical protein
VSALLAGGHSQLFGACTGGLAQAWERASHGEDVEHRVQALGTVRREPGAIGRLQHRLAWCAAAGTLVLVLVCGMPWVLAASLADVAEVAVRVPASPAPLPISA